MCTVGAEVVGKGMVKGAVKAGAGGLAEKITLFPSASTLLLTPSLLYSRHVLSSALCISSYIILNFFLKIADDLKLDPDLEF